MLILFGWEIDRSFFYLAMIECQLAKHPTKYYKENGSEFGLSKTPYNSHSEATEIILYCSAEQQRVLQKQKPLAQCVR